MPCACIQFMCNSVLTWHENHLYAQLLKEIIRPLHVLSPRRLLLSLTGEIQSDCNALFLLVFFLLTKDSVNPPF